MLEAMATGRAVVTTDAPGCGRTVGVESFGAAVPVRDPRALAAAMIALGADPARRVSSGAAARRAATERFDASRNDAAILRCLGLAD